MTRAEHHSFDWEALAACAANLLAGRQRHYPTLVAEGKLTADKAEAGLRIMGAIAADWRRIVALYANQPAPPRDTTATADEKHHALEAAVETLRRALTKLRKEHGPSLPAWFTWQDLESNLAGGTIDATVARKLLRAFERHHLAASLLAHATCVPGPMFYAELTAELRERDRSAAQAA